MVKLTKMLVEPWEINPNTSEPALTPIVNKILTSNLTKCVCLCATNYLK
jgi:hypothetical protein